MWSTGVGVTSSCRPVVELSNETCQIQTGQTDTKLLQSTPPPVDIRESLTKERRSGRKMVMELFFGTCGLSKALAERGFHATAIDKDFAGVDKDGGVRLLAAGLLLPATTDMLLNIIRKRRCCYIHFGIECSSFSFLRIRGHCSSR